MRAYSLTDVGMMRDSNQDYVYTSQKKIGCLDNLFIVADGMGGHNAGDFASKYTVERIVEYIEDTDSTQIADIFQGAIDKANRGLMMEAGNNPVLNGMGTTVVMATITDDTIYVANVGDSRLYLMSKEAGIRQITKDHSLVQEMVRMGEMDAAEAVHHPDKNIITRAVGAFDNIEADFFEEKVQPGDYVIMCSDGLTNMVDDAAIGRVLESESDVVDKVKELINQSNRNGGKDNITVAVIEI